jgi:tyrosine-protein kinase Etk/Wzc
MTTGRTLIEEDQPTASPPSGFERGDNTSEDDGISLLDLLVVIARRKRTVIWVTAICFVAAVVISLVLPKRYTATVTVMPPQQNTSMGAALASQLGNLGGMASLAGGSLGLKNPNDMYVAMLKSRTVEDAMVQRFDLMKEYKKRYASDARKSFEGRTTVDGSGKDTLIYISVEDHDPRRAAELANGYVDQFRDLSAHLAITEAAQRRVFFERELEQAKDNLASAEEALKQTELSTGVIQPDSQARALIESAATLRAEITAREVQIQGMQTYATGENSQLVQAQRELAGLRAQLAKLGGSEDNNGGEFLVPKGRIPETGMEYVRKLRDVKYYETIFDILARQFEVAKLDEAKEGSLIQVVDPAVVPDRRSFPKRGLIVLGATAFGFFLGVMLALFQTGFEHLKQNPEAAAKLAMLKGAISPKRHGTT